MHSLAPGDQLSAGIFTASSRVGVKPTTTRAATRVFPESQPIVVDARIPDRSVLGVPGIKPSGSFVQYFLIKDWDDQTWQREFQAMKQAGMNLLVFAPTVNESDGTAYYDSHIEGFKPSRGEKDVVERCLRNATKEGIEVFLGLNMNEQWWQQKALDPKWLTAEMTRGNAVADELYHGYKTRYPKAFHGWYWVWEIENARYEEPNRREAITKAIDLNLRHCHALDPAMPVMLCPYMLENQKPEEYGAFWTYLFAHADFRAGDIFCPQDCVGAGWIKIDRVNAWFSEFRKAVATKPGLRFWSDMETFGPGFQSAPLDRFVKQIQIEQPLVERIITFAYCHYYSPVSTNPGWQRDYLTYLRSGKLPLRQLAEPADVSAKKREDGKVEITWGASPNDGYEVFRDAVPIGRVGPESLPRPTGARASFTDKNPTASGRYSVRAYDFSGNVSKQIVAVQTLALNAETR